MDPIADMLTRIRNASLLMKSDVVVPHSKLKAMIAELLSESGYLGKVKTETTDAGRTVLRLELRYRGGEPAIRTLRRLSSPGLRVYAKATDIPKPRGGFGVVVISTPHGLMTGEQARRRRTGGELICEVLS